MRNPLYFTVFIRISWVLYKVRFNDIDNLFIENKTRKKMRFKIKYKNFPNL